MKLKIKNLRRSDVVIAIVLSIYLASSLSLSMNIAYTGNTGDLYPYNFMAGITLWNLAMFLLVLFISSAALILAMSFLKESSNRINDSLKDSSEVTLNEHIKNHGSVILLTSIITFVIWFIVFMNYYPGTSMNDQLAIIGHPIEFSNNHPILYNLILSGLVRQSISLSGSGEFGFALYVLIQMLISIMIITFCISWMRWRNVSKIACSATWLYFTICPTIVSYSFCTIKDTLFAYILLLWIPFIWEFVVNQREFRSKLTTFTLFILLSISTSLIRNNGIYIVVFVGLALVLRYFKKGGIKLIPALIVAVAISSVPNMILAGMGVHQLFREAVGIPIQQIASVLASRPDSVSKDDADYLNTLLKGKSLNEAYAPMSVDMIKYDASFDTEALENSKEKFIKVYIDLGLSNPDLYLYSLLSQTWGYWSVTATNGTQSWFLSVSDNYKSELDSAAIKEFGISNRSFYPASVSKAIDNGLRTLLALYPGSGFLFFCILLFSLLINVKLERGLFAICLPYIGLWLTLLIASPISCALRYGFPFAVSFPIILSLIFTKKGSRQKCWCKGASD